MIERRRQTGHIQTSSTNKIPKVNKGELNEQYREQNKVCTDTS